MRLRSTVHAPMLVHTWRMQPALDKGREGPQAPHLLRIASLWKPSSSEAEGYACDARRSMALGPRAPHACSRRTALQGRPAHRARTVRPGQQRQRRPAQVEQQHRLRGRRREQVLASAARPGPPALQGIPINLRVHLLFYTQAVSFGQNQLSITSGQAVNTSAARRGVAVKRCAVMRGGVERMLSPAPGADLLGDGQRAEGVARRLQAMDGGRGRQRRGRAQVVPQQLWAWPGQW